jgi:hypothetical protein
MKKKPEPSQASLRAIPEVDFTRFRRLRRGKYAARARRAFAVALIEPEVFARFGSSEAVSAALRALIEASESIRAAGSVKAKVGRKATRRRAA